MGAVGAAWARCQPDVCNHEAAFSEEVILDENPEDKTAVTIGLPALSGEPPGQLLQSYSSSHVPEKLGLGGGKVCRPSPLEDNVVVEAEPQLSATGVVIDFWDGSALNRAEFTKLPLGFSFVNEMPIVVTRVESGGHAEALGVKSDWELRAINDQPLAERNIRATLELLQAATDGIPKPDTDLQ